MDLVQDDSLMTLGERRGFSYLICGDLVNQTIATSQY